MTFFFSSRLLTEEMASFLVLGGRVLFLFLIITQSLMLAAYPATYKDDSNWYAVATSQAPSVIIWLCLVLFSGAKLQRLFYVWGFYIIGLVISIAIVFGFVGDALDKKIQEGRVYLYRQEWYWNNSLNIRDPRPAELTV